MGEARLIEKEIARLLPGSVGKCPGEEATASTYAQHWADSNANPEPEPESISFGRWKGRNSRNSKGK